MLSANAIITSYAVKLSEDGAGRDTVSSLPAATLNKVGGSIRCDLGTPSRKILEDLTQRGIQVEHTAVLDAATVSALGITPKARDRVTLVTHKYDGTANTAEVFTVGDIGRPVDPGLGGSMADWALYLVRGGGQYVEAA
ncbi:MAG: hypothetical protein H6826_14330 [Planctomycetes bacterium]|nr:hypothetical protein [Planctomycetota bacterium]